MNRADGYLTEKIRMALMAGSIPIYWGDPRVAEFINPACFINCHDYPNFAAVIEHVKEVDQNPELYGNAIAVRQSCCPILNCTRAAPITWYRSWKASSRKPWRGADSGMRTGRRTTGGDTLS